MGSRDVAVTTVLDGTHDLVLRDVVTVDVVSQLAAEGPRSLDPVT
jgi:hypothetical protein